MMTNKKTYSSVIIFFNVFFIFFAAISIFHLTQKPGLPEEFQRPGQITIDGIQVFNQDESEFFISKYRVGDAAILEIAPDFQERTVRLVNYCTTFSIMLDAFIMVCIFALGFSVYIFRSGEKSSLIFHIATTAVAASLVGTKTIYTVQPPFIGYTCCFIFNVAYTVVPVLFVHFTFLFPAVKWQKYKKFIVWAYLLASVIAVWDSSLYLRAAVAHSMILYKDAAALSMVKNGFVFLFLVLGVLNFVYSYRTASSSTEKRKIRWILYGISIGTAPFIFLWVLPEALGFAPWVPEVIFKFFLFLIPLTFAVSILRHRLMDIDLVINRSAVYAIVLGMGLILYIGIVGAAAKILSSLTEQASLTVSTLTAVILALLFEPARRRVQCFVDRSFFRVQYNFREAQRRYVEEIKGCIDIRQIADLLVCRTDELIPLERSGFFSVRVPDYRLQLLVHKNFELLEKHSVRLEVDKLKTGLNLPVALDEMIEPGTEHETADSEVFRRWGMALVFPMKAENSEILGFLVLGEKKSHARFTVEDVDLLNTFTAQAGLAIERINLQQKLLVEHAEAQRLEELSRLKSYFVSSVSHDLKTPLASIKMFAELLRTRKKLPVAETREYLEIIEGESERLARLINNVLDFAKIERGQKEYRRTNVELNKIVSGVLRSLKYQFKMEKCKVRTNLCKSPCIINADADAVTEALINLVSNGIKYSPDKKEIIVSTYLKETYAALQVEDKGIGISPDDMRHIFEPFFRGKEVKAHGAGGAGLGLALVRHVMDAHGGRIEAASEPGKGSVFTLLFPSEPAEGLERIYKNFPGQEKQR